MKILMLVNWKVKKCDEKPEGVQPPDYYVQGEPYWFYRYFSGAVQVDVLDISSFPALERFEREKLRFYILQSLKAIPKLGKYDLIVSHGMQSGVVISLWRRLFRTKAKHIVFDIGSFNSAAESGGALRLMQWASKSIDGLIYHSSPQLEYYRRFFPWLADRAHFVKFGTDADFFGAPAEECGSEGSPEEKVTGTADTGSGASGKASADDGYILCVGYHQRDWDTLVRAYAAVSRRREQVPALRLIGAAEYRVPGDVQLLGNAELQTSAYIPVEELKKYIRGALLCVLPLENLNFSFGQMTLLQQMALGKAVITAKVPSMVDYVRDGDTGFLYSPGSTCELAAVMERLLDAPELCEQTGARAAGYVHEEYNEKNMAHAIESVYSDVCDHGRK